jgi:hypothetical protein
MNPVLRRRAFAATALSFGIALVTSPLAWAAVVIPQTTEMLTHEATHIVRGVVEHQVLSRDEAVHHAVVETTIRVEEVFKGVAPERIVIRQLRGIPGDARFTEGEEVVVFVREGVDVEKGFHFLLGLAQGKFQVRRSLKGPVSVSRDYTDLHLVEPGSRPVIVERVATLDELRTRIRTTVQAEGSAR